MGYATNSPIGLSGFSAAGPTDDGRIKPDIMAVGLTHGYVIFPFSPRVSPTIWMFKGRVAPVLPPPA